MKKRMNRHVALLLAVLMLFSSIGINAFAATNIDHECTTNKDNPNFCNVVNPTCETQGYTEYLCVYCRKPMSKGNYKNALGHQFKATDYEPATDENAYYKYDMCVREYTQNGEVVSRCNAIYYETEGDKRPLYKRVIFKNNKVTVAYDTTITHAMVASDFTTQVLYSTFVKVGDEVVFKGDINPYREKTVNYGEYKCIGWSTDDKLEALKGDNLDSEDCADLKTLTADTEYASVSDIVLYPVFQGVDKTYEVVFYNDDLENLTRSQKVNHGEYPKYSKPNGEPYAAPLKAEDFLNYYRFKGWATESGKSEGIPLSDIESTAIYDNVYYYPAYEPVAKNFVIEFYDESGENLLFAKEGIDLQQNFYTYGVDDDVNVEGDVEADGEVDVDGEVENKPNPYKEILQYSLTEVEKASDDNYVYHWAGWQVLRQDNTAGTKVVTIDKYGNPVFNGFKGIIDKDVINEVDENGNTIYLDGELEAGLIPEEEVQQEPRKVIRLVPVYTTTYQRYVVDIKMDLSSTKENDNYYKGQATVTIKDKYNQFAEGGFTDENGKFRCWLVNNAPFTVEVATHDGKYRGTATISYLFRVPGGDDVEASVNECSVKMELNPDYEKHCSCIHHNALFAPIVVRIFNILYTFFNVKYVCCYDMYSTIGPLLDYTA